MQRDDILNRLRIDPGQRTLGQLLQEREAAAQEIRKLRAEIERLQTLRIERKERAEGSQAGKQTIRPGSLIRIGEVCELVGTSRSTIYRWVSECSFPQPVRVSERAVRWKIDEIEQWRNAL